MQFQIGAHGWVQDLKNLTLPLGQNFLSGLSPVSSDDIEELESKLKRSLPEEFVEFYRTIGCGDFPDRNGGFYTPDEILMSLGAPVYFLLGSLSSGKEWCSEEEHRRLWLTRGSFNPSPTKFTQDAMTIEGVKLYDLLQFGWNGSCCYHQLYVGPQPSPVSYCLLTDYETIEDRTPTFSEGVETLLRHYLSDLNQD